MPASSSAVSKRLALGLMIGGHLRVEARRQLLQARGRANLQRRGRADISQVVEVRHRRHPSRVGSGVADAPAGNRKGLAEARNHDGALAHAGQRGRANVPRAVVDEVLVNFVGEQEEIVLDGRVARPLRARAA